MEDWLMRLIMKIATALALLLTPLALMVGCDKMTAAKDRAATLTCAKHGGYKSYRPKIDHLEVLCNDGTLVSVKWLP